MRSIFLYLRQVLCRHEFLYSEKMVDDEFRKGFRCSLICKKCAYNKKFWKYL